MKIVVIEGGDACGKATQTALLAERLGGVRFSFPNYESETGRAILGNLKKEWLASPTMQHPLYRSGHFGDAKLNSLVFQCLQTANRLECLPEIRQALARGPVVFDRYWLSAVVYGGLDGLDPEWLERVQAAPMPVADVQILLDVPLEETWRRRPERRDRYEVDREFLERVREEYLRQFCDRGARGENFVIVDGVGSVKDVHRRICAAIRLCGFKIGENASWTPAGGWLEVG